MIKRRSNVGTQAYDKKVEVVKSEQTRLVESK